MMMGTGTKERQKIPKRNRQARIPRRGRERVGFLVAGSRLKDLDLCTKLENRPDATTKIPRRVTCEGKRASAGKQIGFACVIGSLSTLLT
jgi:hypothetical protein